jgi:hypothetical protein
MAMTARCHLCYKTMLQEIALGVLLAFIGWLTFALLFSL